MTLASYGNLSVHFAERAETANISRQEMAQVKFYLSAAPRSLAFLG